jgi:hypothetical protein
MDQVRVEWWEAPNRRLPPLPSLDVSDRQDNLFHVDRGVECEGE